MTETSTSLTFDFGRGPVPAHRHVNPDGSLGGWVANTARVFGTAWVFGDARVFGNAQVFGTAWVSGTARVCWGYAAPYHWTAWVEEDGDLVLAIGCCVWPLAWWLTLGEEIARENAVPWTESRAAQLDALATHVMWSLDLGGVA